MDPKETILDKAEQSQSHKRPSDAFSLSYDVEELLKPELPSDTIYNIGLQELHTVAEISHSTNNSNVSLLGICDSRLYEQQKRERKREIDRLYRKRRKQNIEEMEKELEVLTTEDEYLKNENGSFKKDNAWMNQTLKDRTKEIGRLKSDLLQLKREYDEQNVLVQTLSSLLADSVRLENERLKDENALLKSTNNLGNNVLVEENVKLRLENKVLKVQIDALCGKIINDNDTKH